MQNWKVFMGAVTKSYWTTAVTIANTTKNNIEIDIVFGPYEIRKPNGAIIIPGSGVYDLRKLTRWNYFTGKIPGQAIRGEFMLYVEKPTGIEVSARIEHIYAWIGAGQKMDTTGQLAPKVIQLEHFPYQGPAPFGPDKGRVAIDEDTPFYGPGNVGS